MPRRRNPPVAVADSGEAGPSLAAVARHAGVSATAVSLVLSGRAADYRLSDDTSARVLAAAAALGYVRPSRRRGPSRLHVLHLEDLLRMDARGLGGTVLHPLMDALTVRGWLASVDPRMPADPATAGPALLAATALVVPVNLGFDASARAAVAVAAAHGVQPVVIGRHLADLPGIQVDGDQQGGGRLLAEHLLGLGHRRIALVGGSSGDPHTAARLAGVCAAFAAARLRPDPADAWGDGDYDLAAAHRLVAARLAAGLRPTAILCCNDRMAVGALLALREAGLRVPQDVSLTGFDDQGEFSAVAPGLTTVRIDATGIGAQVAALLAPGAALRHDRFTCPALLVARGSTAESP